MDPEDFLPYELESTDWIRDLLNPRKRDRDAMIFHHTGGASLGGAQKTLFGRGLLGYDYFIDRDGRLIRNPNIPEGGFGAHMRPGQGPGLGLSNRNTIGVGFVGTDEDDLTPQQIAVGQAFAATRGHGPGSVFGHGEVNPHKDPREGMTAVDAIRGQLRPQTDPTAAMSEFTTQADLDRQREQRQRDDQNRINRNYAGLMGGSRMDILDGLAPRQQQGGGGLLGMLGNPMAQAYIAQILKGLSPYSNLNPDDMLARAQRMQLAEQERAREDFYKRQQQDMAERGMSLREREEMRGIDQGVAQRKAYADAWRHMQANPGAEGVMGALQQYGESMTESGRNALLRHAEFLEKQSGKATDKARNAPAGYLWVDENDPSKGVTAIKGGPAEKLPAEFAGRIGLAKSFLGQMPSIRERLEKGEISSPSGSLRAWMGRGKEGELRRQIDSGADALVRGLTGAGMAIAEAQNYARRYQFHPWDTKEDQISKLDQLQRELETIAEVAQAGRGRPAGDGGGSAGQSEPKYKEGQTATGPGGKKLIFRGGEWVEQ